jgi:tryptophan 2,3-dioxygenase
VVIQQCLASEMRILQTLTPDTFQEIRRNLGNGSGLESPGYNRVLVATGGDRGGRCASSRRVRVPLRRRPS